MLLSAVPVDYVPFNFASININDFLSIHTKYSPILLTDNVKHISGTINKSILLLVNFAGIYMVNPKKLLNDIHNTFISIFCLEKIVFDNNLMIISTFDNNTYNLLVNNWNELGCLIKFIFNNLKDGKKRSITLVNVPKSSIYLEKIFHDIIIPMKYYSHCTYKKKYYNQLLADLIYSTSVHESNYISLDDKIELYGNCESFCYVLESMGNLFHITFNKFEPNFVLHLFSSIINKMELKSFTFMNYNFLNTNLLKFKNNNQRVISLTFAFCNIPANNWRLLFDKFAEFHGCVQFLEFKHCSFDIFQLKEIVNGICRCRCFRSLETLSIKINNINTEINDFQCLLMDIFSHCRFIYCFSCLYIPLNFISFINYDTGRLTCLTLSGQDLGNLTSEITISCKIKSLVLSNCRFSGCSFINFVSCLTKCESLRSLSFKNSIITKEDWNLIFEELGSIKSFTSLVEFDWSGNIVPRNSISVFRRVFLENIEYLSINDIFAPSTRDILRSLVSGLKIFGLSVHSQKNKYYDNNNIDYFLETLNELEYLKSLDIANYYINEKTFCSIVEFLERKSIIHFSCDETAFNDTDSFFKFYDKIFKVGSIKGLSRPSHDILRLNLDATTKEFNRFRRKFYTYNDYPSFIDRSVVYDLYFPFRKDFPDILSLNSNQTAVVLSRNNILDKYGLYKTPFFSSISSVYLNASRFSQTMISSQNSLLRSPFIPPKDDPKQKYDVEEAKSKLQNIISNSYNIVVCNIPFISLQNPKETPELRSAFDILARSVQEQVNPSSIYKESYQEVCLNNISDVKD